MPKPIALRIATYDDIGVFITAAIKNFLNGSEEEARSNLGPYDENDTSFIIAYEGDAPVAVVTIRWNPHYPPFKDAGIPFIQNIEVKWELRGMGYGNRVMEAVEQHIAKRADKAGICVALFDDYGPAQRLYARRGFVPTDAVPAIALHRSSEGKQLRLMTIT